MTATMRVLYTGQEIRKEMHRIFSKATQRRVAVVAFVGEGALAHVANPKGLEVYCWPLAGSTNAGAIAALLHAKARVFFAQRMHAKVYWSETSGAVVGSANLSDNAFGRGDLREAGVALPSDRVDIDKLIASIKAKEVTPESLEELRREEAVANAKRKGGVAKPRLPTFQEWYDGRGGGSWKWDYWDSFGGGASKRAKEAVKRINPTYVPHAHVYCNRDTLKESDWVLHVKKGKGGALMSPQWIYVDSVVLVGKTDRYYIGDYPFQAVQGRESRHCPAPPFLIDSAFRGALRRASIEFGPDRIAEQVESKPPTAAFLKRIRDAL